MCYAASFACQSRTADYAVRGNAVATIDAKAVTIDVNAELRTRDFLYSARSDWKRDVACRNMKIVARPPVSRRASSAMFFEREKRGFDRRPSRDWLERRKIQRARTHTHTTCRVTKFATESRPRSGNYATAYDDDCAQSCSRIEE